MGAIKPKGKSRTRQILDAVNHYHDSTGRYPTYAWLTDKKGFPPALLATMISAGALVTVGDRYKPGEMYNCPSRQMTAEEKANLEKYGTTVAPKEGDDRGN